MGNSTISFILVSLLLCGCQSTYYKFWETFGREKRDLLQANVEAASEQQDEIKEEFQDVLTRIRTEYRFEEGKAEEVYDRLKSDYENASEQRDALRARTEKVRQIAGDLFAEWQKEAVDLKNPRYRQQSLEKLAKAKVEFRKLSNRMAKTEAELDRVLSSFKDQVIFLKHNLNAKALKVFEEEFVSVQTAIEELIRSIESSMQASQDFQKTLP